MRPTFVQCADVLLEPDGSAAAPGGAVTLALCGSWDHAGACRWPHKTSVVWDGCQGRVRVVFVAGEEDEKHVRVLINQALVGGECVGPDGMLNRWVASSLGTGELGESDAALGARTAGLHG